METSDLPISDRLKVGQKAEKKIITQLRGEGYEVIQSSEEDDRYRKVDGYIKVNDTWRSFQYKFREVGEDILMEVVYDINDDFSMGRDLKGKAELYVYTGKYGTTRLYQYAPIKEKAIKIRNKLIKGLKKTPDRIDWSDDKDPTWMATIREDRGDKGDGNEHTKIVVYFVPEAFKILCEWEWDLSK
jgi:hypothetical protein